MESSLQSGPLCQIAGLVQLWFGLFQTPPDCAWADGNLAELAKQVCLKLEHLKLSYSGQPNYQTRWTTLYLPIVPSVSRYCIPLPFTLLGWEIGCLPFSPPGPSLSPLLEAPFCLHFALSQRAFIRPTTGGGRERIYAMHSRMEGEAWRSIDRPIEYLGIHMMMRYSFHLHKWGYWLYYYLQGRG